MVVTTERLSIYSRQASHIHSTRVTTLTADLQLNALRHLLLARSWTCSDTYSWLPTLTVGSQHLQLALNTYNWVEAERAPTLTVDLELNALPH